MGKAMDLTGQKFGRLTVIKRSFPNTKNGETNWLCKCDCGNKKIIHGHRLRIGKTKSCGCLRREICSSLQGKYPQSGLQRYLGIGVGNMRAVISKYKQNAKKGGREYKLTEEQFKEITKKDCYYCGAKPNNERKSSSNNGGYVYNGIDRIDNNKGYTMDNIVPCCRTCNIAKRNLTLQDFKDWIKRVHNHMFIGSSELIVILK